MNILFIGNSYTFYNDLPSMFEGLAKENGKNVCTFSITEGGRRLIKFQDQEDPYTKKLESLLAKEYFDVVFLQEQSILPASEYETFFSGVEHLVYKLKDNAKRIILYSTWGRKNGSPDLENRGWTNESMTAILANAYEKAADALGLEVSYVGKAFKRASDASVNLELHDPDKSHPSYAGSVLAALTHYKQVFGKLPERTDSIDLESEVLAVLLKAAE